MKTVKKIFLFAICLASIQFVSAQSQTPTNAQKEALSKQHERGKHQTSNDKKDNDAKLSPEQRAEKLTQKMTKNLQLNQQQTAKVAEINLNNAKQIAEIRNSTLSRYEKFNKIQSIEQHVSGEFRQILTPEQYKKFELGKEKRKDKVEDRIDNRIENRMENKPPAQERADHRTTKMVRHLQLDEKQTTMVQEINLQNANAIDRILSSKLEKADRLKQLDAQNKQYEASLQRILTPEQFKKAQALKEEMKNKRHEK